MLDEVKRNIESSEKDAFYLFCQDRMLEYYNIKENKKEKAERYIKDANSSQEFYDKVTTEFLTSEFNRECNLNVHNKTNKEIYMEKILKSE